MNPAETPILVVRDLVVQRHGVPVVRGASLDVRPSQVVAIVGPNGSGKTTMLEAVSGVIKPSRGTVSLRGADITKKSRRHRSLLGLRHVRQGRSIFADLSVEENLRVTANDVEMAFEIFPELRDRARLLAKDLSGGEQQMLVLAQALISQPSCILIDEISLGLAPRVVKRLIGAVKEAAEAGSAILLVEQFASVAMDIAEVAVVLVRGKIALIERTEALRDDPSVLHNAYLGRDLPE